MFCFPGLLKVGSRGLTRFGRNYIHRQHLQTTVALGRHVGNAAFILRETVIESQLIIALVSQKSTRKYPFSSNAQVERTSGLRRPSGVCVSVTVVAKMGLCEINLSL